jgi:hypothetical protein
LHLKQIDPKAKVVSEVAASIAVTVEVITGRRFLVAKLMMPRHSKSFHSIYTDETEETTSITAFAR